MVRRLVRRVVALGMLALLLPLLAGCTEPKPGPKPEPASLVVTGGRIWTGDAERPWAEALASRGEEIVAVGSAADVEPWIGAATQLLRADDGLVVPGFIDCHVHVLDGGIALASVQLRDAATPEEFTRRIADFAATIEPGEWILGGTWDHTLWGGELPHRDWIDAVTPDNPVFVQRLDGHMGLANSLALELAGVDEQTADVEGGTIVRDAAGRPTGLLKDNAMEPVLRVVTEPSGAQLDRALEAALRYLAAHGVTTVHAMEGGVASWASLAAFRRAESAGSLITRVYAMVPLSQWRELRDDVAANGRGSEWLKTGGVKGFMDGSLGSHTAAFFESFTDTPDDRGFLINDPGEMRQWIEGADAAGLQVVVHAIGDRAIRDLLDLFAAVAEANGPRDRRFRIEHAQHIHPSDVGRFAAQDVIASMQPYHAIDDGRWAEEVIGPERARTTYAFRSLLDAGARVAFGSDWFVAPATPIEGIYAAVTRRTLDDANPGGWVPEQKITVEEALRAYTYQAAYASFDEKRKGTLEPGLLADLVVLDRDLTAIAPEAIRDAQVLHTVVGGKLVYSRRD